MSASKSDGAGSRAGSASARRARPAPKAAREHGFKPGADRLPEDRRRAVGRDADDERRAVDDRAKGKIAMRGLVDEIDQNAGGARGGGEALRLRLVVEAAHREHGAAQVGGSPGPMLHPDCAARRLRRDRAQLLARTFGKDIDLGAGRRQELRFPRHRRPVAGDDRALAGEREEDRQPRERCHARRMRRRDIARERRHQYTSC
jgi:hypothetical protein